MTVVLYRVDERLIHGQVVIGWGSELRPDRYVVVDDTLAGSDWEQELYRLGLPDGVEASFLDVAGARAGMAGLQADGRRTVLLTRDVDTMARLAEGRLLEGRSVNLGGIHPAEGRTPVRPWLHLGARDRAGLRALASEGVTVTGRDLPGSVAVGTDDLLEEEED